MKRLVLGVIGHVDHGKTALVRALTGIDTDRLPEEKRRGISIALGFAHLSTAAAVVDLIDMPGHERFVRTMVSGATGIDAALLVVDARDGIQPQTVEHVDIAALLGLQRAVVAVSKADLVPTTTAAAAGEAAAMLLRAAGIAVAATVVTSALRGDGLDDLREKIAMLAAEPRPADGVAFLPIDRAFTVPGHGTVVTGTLRGGAIGAGDTLDLFPRRRTVRVRSVQVHGARVALAAPGQRVAINLRDVELADVKRGTALYASGALSPSAWLTLTIRAVQGAPPLANGALVSALLGTSDVEARLRLLDRDVLGPGEVGLAQLRCSTPLVTPAREHVVLRLASPSRTVAGGVVIEPQTTRRRRHDRPTSAWLAAAAEMVGRDLVVAEVRRAGLQGVGLAGLSRLSALSTAVVASVLSEHRVFVDRHHVAMTQDALAQVRAGIPPALAQHREGLSRERLALLLGVGAAVLETALQQLLTAGTVQETRGNLCLQAAAADRAQARAALSAELSEALRRGGLTPPDPATLMTDVERKRAVDQLLRAGVIVRARDSGQKRDVLFHQEAIEEARRRLRPMLASPPGLLVSEAGAALGISRKFSVPLLEHFDEIRFTRRVQDRRILAQSCA